MGYEILECIAHTLNEDLKNQLAISPFIGIMLDTSTDVNHEEFIVFNINYLKNGYKKEESYIRINYINSSDGLTIYTKLN